MKSALMFPKPEVKKKRKKRNGWKDKSERRCHYCGTTCAERHEVYGGPNRQASIDFRFQLDLCPACHRAWHAQANELWIERKQYWQKHFQEAYEQKLIDGGIRPDQARELWINLIGKNFI